MGAFAFYMDRQKEERERGVTIACTTKEFYTDKWHYTVIDAPGHRDFIKGVGDVLAGRVEQGQVKPGEEVVFLPTHTASNPCTGKVFTVEMHHTRADFANPGDNVGLNIKGLDKNNMPRSGDVMVYKKDTILGQTKEFSAQIQVLDIPNEIKVGYSPIGFVRCGRSACRISKLNWKMGKETGGKKMEDPHSLKSNEMAASNPSSPWCATPSRIARVSLVLLSWMA